MCIYVLPRRVCFDGHPTRSWGVVVLPNIPPTPRLPIVKDPQPSSLTLPSLQQRRSAKVSIYTCTCERYLTHRPSSQGWASGVLLFHVCCVCDFDVCICLFVWVGMPETLPFSSFYIFSLLACYTHVFPRNVYMYAHPI